MQENTRNLSAAETQVRNCRMSRLQGTVQSSRRRE